MTLILATICWAATVFFMFLGYTGLIDLFYIALVSVLYGAFIIGELYNGGE